MSGAPADRPRFQLRIRWLMIAVAIAAIVLAVPFLQAVAMIAAIPSGLIGGAALVASRSRRRAVAFWVAALHPLGLVAWLMLARWIWFNQPLRHSVFPPGSRWALELPYADVLLAILVTLPALFFGSLVSYGVRRGTGIERVFALPFIWATVYLILDGDPFALRTWFWD